MTFEVLVPTPAGHRARYATRPDTNDASLAWGIVAEDEYGLKHLPPLSGWVIDIGAHIGTVAVALAIDNPDVTIVAVEALPENVAVLRETVALNGLDERIHVIEAAAGAPGETDVPITYGWTQAENQPDDYIRESRFIGGMVGPNDTSTTLVCPAISLDAICEQFGIDEVALLKIDCEGCEWFVLRSPVVARCERIIGELHWGKQGTAKEFRALLEPTHEVVLDDARVVSLFGAVRR